MSTLYIRYPSDGGSLITIGSPPNGLDLTNNVLTIALASTSTTGALSSTDWNTFNNKQSTLTLGNLTDVGTDGITITGGTGAVVGSGTSIAQHVADASHNGYLSSTDWSTFNAKQAALTIGNLTDAGTDGIVVTGGTGSIIGSGVAIAQHVADATHNGYLSSADWSTFNGKQAAGNYITALTGDATASGPGSAALTLATVATPGTNTKITFNAKGLVTSAAAAVLASSDYANQGTTTTVLHGNASGNPSFGAVSLTADVSGILPIANGGTNQGSAYTSGSIIFSNGTSLVQDNANLFWDDTNFTIGVGTASPSAASCMDVVANTSKAVRISAYGTAAIPAYQGRAARGTSGSPTATQSGDSLAVLAGRGYGATGFVSAASTGSISFQAEGNFTDSSMPTNITFNVTPSASTTVGSQMRLSAGGNLLLGTLTDSTTQKLQVIGNSKVGTVTSGTWNGDAVAIGFGGTGQATKAAGFDALSPMSASGDIIYGGASGTGTRLAKGSDGQVLTLASGLPSWAAASSGTAVNMSAGLTSNYTTSANAAIKYDTAVYDTNSAYSTGTGNYTVPTTGKYRVSTVTDAQTSCNVYLAINGTGYVYLSSTIAAIANGYISASATVSVTAGDTIAIFADAARTFSGKTGSLYQNYVSIEKVG